MSAGYVKHDGQRWHIRKATKVDGQPAYILQQMRPGKAPRVVLARASECEPWKAPSELVRVFRDGDYVLEIITAGKEVRAVKCRRAKTSKRWDTSVPAIFRLTVAAHVAKNRKPRRRRF